VLAFASLGLPDGVLGVAWPSIWRTFDLPLSQLGGLLAASMAGYLLSTFSSGSLAARIGLGRLLLGSTAAMLASVLAYALAPTWGAIVAAGVVAGLGAGAIDAGMNAFAAAHFSPRRVNWLHAAYGAGAMLGPLSMTATLSAGFSWRIGYALIGLALCGTAVCFWRTIDRWTVTSAEAAPTGGAPAGGLRDALRCPGVWLNVLVFFGYTGLEVSAGQWTYSLFTEERGIAPAVAGVAVASYWGSLTVGRLVAGVLTRRVAVERLLRAGLVGALLGALVIWRADGPEAAVAGAAILGFSLAPIFPLLIVTTPRRVGVALSSQAIGLQVGAAYLGTAALPGLAGVLARHAGLDVIGPFLVIGALVVLGLHEAVDRAAPAASSVSRLAPPAEPRRAS
jgi:fucose permease